MKDGEYNSKKRGGEYNKYKIVLRKFFIAKIGIVAVIQADTHDLTPKTSKTHTNHDKHSLS
jgi:hypothetical protein